MLQSGPDILSSAANPRIIGTTKGYIVKCISDLGICFEEKTKTKHYLRYETTEYQDGFNIFSRIEVFSPNGELLYIHDCTRGHSHCNMLKLRKISDIFKVKYGSQYFSFRPRKKSKPKIKNAKTSFGGYMIGKDDILLKPQPKDPRVVFETPWRPLPEERFKQKGIKVKYVVLNIDKGAERPFSVRKVYSYDPYGYIPVYDHYTEDIAIWYAKKVYMLDTGPTNLRKKSSKSKSKSKVKRCRCKK